MCNSRYHAEQYSHSLSNFNNNNSLLNDSSFFPVISNWYKPPSNIRWCKCCEIYLAPPSRSQFKVGGREDLSLRTVLFRNLPRATIHTSSFTQIKSTCYVSDQKEAEAPPTPTPLASLEAKTWDGSWSSELMTIQSCWLWSEYHVTLVHSVWHSQHQNKSVEQYCRYI